MEKSINKRKYPTNSSCVSKFSCFTTSSSKPVGTSCLFKLKDSAHKIYVGVKKMQQTISPGARFTNLIRGIFTTNGHLNDLIKTSESCLNQGCAHAVNADVKSCLSKSLPDSRRERSTGMKKKVRFCHVDVQVEEDCHRKNLRLAKVPHEDHKRNGVMKNLREPKWPRVDQKRNGDMESYEDLKNYEFVLDFLRARMMIFGNDSSIDWSSDIVELERLSSLKN